MNPLIPTPDTIPVAWGWFEFLLLLTLPLHLICMNMLLGSAGISLYARLRGDESDRRLSYELARLLPFLVAFTVNFGVAPLLFNQVLYGQFLYVSSVLMASYWLAVVPLLIFAYYAIYLYDFRFRSLGGFAAPFLAMALLTLVGIAFIFTNNMSLALDPSHWQAYFGTADGSLLNWSEPTLIPRFLHFVVGGFAVGGLAVAFIGRFWGKRDALVGEKAIGYGMRLFFALTVIQLALGGWFVVSLPREIMMLFMGQSLLATILFSGGLLLSLVVLVTAWQRRVGLTTLLTILLVVVMSVLRDLARIAYHEPFFKAEQLEVIPQYSPMILFFVSLVLGLAIIVWMLRQALTLPPAKEHE
ncbi:MAG: hypothetical protein C0621_07490 [Desulfuromonas sp.]|nr:MAG: hypothetical protein C0621_07490 [Desulfuromonas sp.]